MSEIHREGLKKVVFTAFLFVVAAAEFVKMGLIVMLLPSLFTKLHYSRTVLGWVLSANLLADNLCKSATGWFVDREGPWPVLLAGCSTIFIGLMLLLQFHQNMLLIITGAALIGLGGSPTWPAAIAGTIKISGEDKRASTISLISIVWMVGAGLGICLVGLLIGSPSAGIAGKLLGSNGSYNAAFGMLLGVMAVVILVCGGGWIWQTRLAGMETGPKVFQHDRQRISAIVHQIREIWNLIPGMFFQTFALGMLLPNLFPFVIEQLQMSEMQYYMLLLAGGAVVVLCMNPVGRMIDRYGARGFLTAGFLLAGGTLFALVSYATRVNIWGFVALLGLSYALIQPAWNAVLAASIPPHLRGVLMGLFMSIEGLGFAVGPVFGGWLGEAGTTGMLHGYGANLPFGLSGICLLAMAVVYFFHPLKHVMKE